MLEYLTIWLTISSAIASAQTFFCIIYRTRLIALAAATIGHAQTASSAPKSNASIANCR